MRYSIQRRHRGTTRTTSPNENSEKKNEEEKKSPKKNLHSYFISECQQLVGVVLCLVETMINQSDATHQRFALHSNNNAKEKKAAVRIPQQP